MFEDAQVLLGHRLRRVDDHHAHLGPLDRRLRTQEGVVLVAAGLLDPPTDACRVDELVRHAVELNELVDGIDSRAGHRVDDRTLLT